MLHSNDNDNLLVGRARPRALPMMMYINDTINLMILSIMII